LTPRPYQLNCLAAIRTGFETWDSQLAVLATGLGKTVIFSHLAAAWSSRVIVIAHREELIDQAAQKLAAVSGEDPGVEMGERRLEPVLGVPPRLVVSSVQTLSRPNRLAQFDPGDYGLLVIDEAHHAVAVTYRRVLEHFRQNERLKVLGVTATPRRADDLAMGQVFENCCFDYGIEPGVEDGWLVPVRQRAVHVHGLDFSQVRATAGDLNEGDLERILSEETHLHAVAAPTVELAGDNPGLVFCVTVNHAKLLAAVIDRYKPGSVAYLSGETDKKLRRDTVEAFRKGDLQFLCNVGLFLEGFDAPNTAFVVMARPTKSLPLYTQVLGRGTRPLPGVIDPFAGADPAARKAAIAASAKPFMTVLDFVGNSGRHKIVTAADVLGGRYGAPARQQALKVAEESGGALPVEAALELADAELQLLEEEQERERRKPVRAAQARYAAADVSPFAGGKAWGQASPGGGPVLATPKQINYLAYLGVSRATAEGYTKRQASTVIDKLLRGRKAHATG
jgi:superfamily II DNA or RNA helicase